MANEGQKAKRERTFNFSFAEEVNLVRLALEQSSVLECRKTDQCTSKMKNEKWLLITDNFNSTASAVSIFILHYYSIAYFIRSVNKMLFMLI